MGRTVCVFGIALCALSTTTAWAQDKGDTGLTISAPSAIGLIWHASDRLAIRPDFSFGFTETDGEGTLPDISSKSFTLGVSALLYTHRWDELRLYVSPRFTYSHATTSIDNPIEPRRFDAVVVGRRGIDWRAIRARHEIRRVCRGRPVVFEPTI